MPSTHSRRRNFLSQMPTRSNQNCRSSIRLITMSAQKSVNNFKSSATSACSHSSAAARTIWLKRQFLPSRTYVGCPRCRVYTWVLGLTLRSLSCGCPRCRVYTWVLGLTSAESLQSIGEISRLSRKDPRLPSKRPDAPGFFHTPLPACPFRPILPPQPLYPSKFLRIGRHQRVSASQSLPRNQYVICANRFAPSFSLRSPFSRTELA